jgi:hypothetical protein
MTQCPLTILEPIACSTSVVLTAKYLNVRQCKLVTIIIHTAHILQHDNAVRGSPPELGDFCMDNPTCFQITKPGSSNVTLLNQQRPLYKMYQDLSCNYQINIFKIFLVILRVTLSFVALSHFFINSSIYLIKTIVKCLGDGLHLHRHADNRAAPTCSRYE